MAHYNTIYNQLLQFVPRHQFENIVKRYHGDRYTKYFKSWQQFLTLLYAQIRSKDSLRDIETSLATQKNKWYHIGLEKIKRSTLSDANNRRDYRIYEELFYRILSRCRNITPKHKFKFKNELYSLDATVIDLCLNMYPWAKFRKRKGALKIHNLYDHSGSIPTFMVISDGKQHEVKVARNNNLPLSPDSIISMDKAYIDYKWLNSLNKSGVYFVTRAKKNINHLVVGQQKPRWKQGFIYDHKIELIKKEDYPEPLRLIGYYDKEKGKDLVFLTNNFHLAASTIAQIYKSRWQIELFFKWIKQNLKIKSFLGTSKNAVMTQIWIAMIYYLLLRYIKYQTKYSYSLLEMTRIISETIMDRISLIDTLSCKFKNIVKIREPVYQQSLF